MFVTLTEDANAIITRKPWFAANIFTLPMSICHWHYKIMSDFLRLVFFHSNSRKHESNLQTQDPSGRRLNPLGHIQ